MVEERGNVRRFETRAQHSAHLCPQSHGPPSRRAQAGRGGRRPPWLPSDNTRKHSMIIVTINTTTPSLPPSLSLFFDPSREKFNEEIRVCKVLFHEQNRAPSGVHGARRRSQHTMHLESCFQGRVVGTARRVCSKFQPKRTSDEDFTRKNSSKYGLERRPGRRKEPGSAPQSEPHAPTMISIDARDDDDDVVREEEDKDDGLPSPSPLEYPPNLPSFSLKSPTC